MYVTCAINLEKEKESQNKNRIINDFKNKLRKRIPNFDEFLVLFKEIIYTENYTKSRGLARYIQSKFDSLLRSGIQVDYDNMTIEHLIPQSFAKDELSNLIIGMIGNQILVNNKLNEKLSNKSIQNKIKILEENNYPIDEDIRNINGSDLSTIIKRTEKMAEKAYKEIWKI